MSNPPEIGALPLNGFEVRGCHRAAILSVFRVIVPPVHSCHVHPLPSIPAIMDMGQMSNCILLSVTRSCDLLVCSLGLLSQSRDGHPRFADTFGDPLLIEAFQNHDGQAAPDANLIPELSHRHVLVHA